jgi:DNA-binding NarL/FixJ family response regulator
MTTKFRVLVIGGVGESQKKLTSVFRQIREVELVGVIDSGEDGVNQYSRMQPDVIFVDMLTDGISGLETARWIKEQTPSIKIIILASQFNKEFLHAVVTMGFDGYLIKDVTPKLIREALKSLACGNQYLVKRKQSEDFL